MWYGHVDRMEEERVVKRANVEGSRKRGRPKVRWMEEGVKAAV
jgi:predicted ArsR family transcriptional regulator